MAEYREHYEAICAARASLVAVSVDAPEKSEAVRQQLQLPFPILSDVGRRVVQEWGIYNPREKGGIAKPAVLILAADGTVGFGSVDEVIVRVPAADIVRMLQEHDDTKPARRKRLIPSPATFFHAVRNSLRLGVRQPKSRT